jgi:small subunit ribosomal protein S3
VGQKVHPLGFRLGVYRDWDARWFARGNSYGDLVLEDLKIREYLESLLNKAEVSRLEIEKAGDNIRIVIHTARPGLVIGKKGQEIDSLRRKIGQRFGKNVDISVQEVSNPEMDAVLIAKNIAMQLQRRVSFKQAMKRAALSAMRSGAKGIKICCAGRLGGAEIARSEWVRIGSTPLHTLRANIDYGFAEAKTTYGIIGVKVWLGKGEFQNIK